MDGEFATEKVLTPGEAKGMKQGARPMTERELKVLEKKKSQIEDALDEKLKGVVQIKEAPGGKASQEKAVTCDKSAEYASATKEEIEGIVASIEEQKAKGNEAFKAGEYAHGILFCTMALDRATDLPDAPAANPTYVKEGLFQKGLALHAIVRYEEAIRSLAAAKKQAD